MLKVKAAFCSKSVIKFHWKKKKQKKSGALSLNSFKPLPVIQITHVGSNI